MVSVGTGAGLWVARLAKRGLAAVSLVASVLLLLIALLGTVLLALVASVLLLS